MKGISAAVKVGLVVVIVVIVSYGLFKSVSEQASGPGGYTLWAKFRDASGLVDKSRVVIAGLTIGEIVDRRLDGKFARVTVRVRKDSQIWSNSAIYKKSSSLLGEFYLEIDPGAQQSLNAKGIIVENHLLKDGDEIPHVIEATSASDLIAQVSAIVPHVDAVLLEVRDLAADARRVVNGPVSNMADNLDKAVAEDRELVRSVLEKTNHIAGNVDDILQQNRPEVDRIIRNIDEASGDVKDLIAVTKGEIQMTGDDIRKKLDRLDQILADTGQTVANARSISKKIDEPEGTLGKLVNDPTIADNAAQITEDVRGFTHSLFGLQTIVGLRAEYNLMEQLSRAYFSVELWPRPDKFYLFEIVSDPRGDLSNVLTVDQNQNLVRTQVIQWQGTKFTAQYGRKVTDWLAMRFGFKDSTGGFGADIDPWGGRARLSLDAFQFTFDRNPRVRATLALRFFQYIYILAGVDDILNTPTKVEIRGNNLTGQFPKTYFYGRDPFLGVMIRFTDDDLKSLLFVGGSAIGAALK